MSFPARPEWCTSQVTNGMIGTLIVLSAILFLVTKCVKVISVEGVTPNSEMAEVTEVASARMDCAATVMILVAGIIFIVKAYHCGRPSWYKYASFSPRGSMRGGFVPQQ